MSSSLKRTESRFRLEIPPSARRGYRQTIFMLLVSFLLVAAANLTHHFAFHHTNATFSFDGRHYLDTCAMATTAAIDATHGELSKAREIINSEQFKAGILFDGPVIVLIPSFVFSVFQHVPNYTDWRWLVLIYSAIQATTAGLTALLCLKTTGSHRWGLTGGLLFGLYPPSLVNSARYLSEVPTALFLALFLFFISGVSKSKASLLGAGLAAGLVALAKPALVPVVLLATLVACWRSIPANFADSKSYWGLMRLAKVSSLLISVVAVVVLTIFPWFAYTKLVTGTGSITAQRLPAYNAAVGTDRESDGWCTLPDSPYVKLMTTMDSPVPVLLSQWKDDPGGCARLACKRVSRMFAHPFNNFGETVFGLSNDTQESLHLLLLSLGLVGIFIYLIQRVSKAIGTGPDSRLVGDVALFLIAGHCTYLLFQAMSRYAYSASPLFFIFIVLGLKALVSSIRPENGDPSKRRVLLLAVPLAVASFFAIIFAEQLATAKESSELVYSLNPGESLEKQIDLSSSHSPIKPSAALLLIDGNNAIESSIVKLNGKTLKGKLWSIYSSDSCLYGAYPLMSEFAHLLQAPVENFRQWRVLEVPLEDINFRGKNSITVNYLNRQGHQKATIYGDNHPESRSLLSPYYFAYERLIQNLHNLEPRVRQPLKAAPSMQNSMIRELDGTSRTIKGDPSVHLAFLPSATLELRPKAIHPDTCEEMVELSPDSFPIFARDASCGGIRTSFMQLKSWGAISTTHRLKLPMNCTHVLVCLKGKLRSLSEPGKVGIALYVQNKQGGQTVAGRCPDYIQGQQNQWIDFTIEDRLPLVACGGEIESVGVAVYPCAAQDAPYQDRKVCSEAQIKDLSIDVKALHQLDLLGRRLIIF